MSGRNYERLMGREIRFVYSSGLTLRAVVSAASYSIGLTIQGKKDKRYLACFNGPKSPVVKEGKFKFNHKQHRVTMADAYDQIMGTGVFRVCQAVEVALRYSSGVGRAPSADNCPFSQ